MKSKITIVPSLLMVLIAPICYAGDMGTIQPQWRPVVGLGAGFAFSSNVGRAQTFPIQNPITDEFFVYTPTHRNQTNGLFEVFLGAERPFYANWLFQGGVAYSQISPYHVKGTLLQGADVESADLYQYQYKVVGREVLAQAKFMYPYHDRFYPYLLAGIGGSFNKASDFETTVPPFLTFTRMYTDHTSNSFAYKVGLGVDMDITEHARLGLAYRFSGLGRVRFGATRIDTTPVNGVLSQSNFYTNEILAQLTFVI